jgi:hypothetical protein
MNVSNALGFLVLGSVMNAVPALLPSIVDHGIVTIDLSERALWLHFMGLVVGAIGGSRLLAECVLSYRSAMAALRLARSTEVRVSGARAANRLQTA